MAESQVILRLDPKILKELDRRIAVRGYGTRSEWLRDQVRRFLEVEARRDMAKRLQEVDVRPMSEGEIVAMVKGWRRRGKGS